MADTYLFFFLLAFFLNFFLLSVCLFVFLFVFCFLSRRIMLNSLIPFFVLCIDCFVLCFVFFVFTCRRALQTWGRGWNGSRGNVECYEWGRINTRTGTHRHTHKSNQITFHYFFSKHSKKGRREKRKQNKAHIFLFIKSCPQLNL